MKGCVNKMKYRKRLSLFMVMILILASLGTGQPGIAKAADITAAFSKYVSSGNTTYQLRNCSSADYAKVVPPTVSVETPVISRIPLRFLWARKLR
jgi:hypothetical protein